jgi:hypothetical protein
LGFTLSFVEIAAYLMDAVTINQTTTVKGGLLKQRRTGRGWLIYAGNLFLRLSHSKIVMFEDVLAWQTWECASYRLLYGGGCKYGGRKGLLIQPFPGRNLRDILAENKLTNEIMIAAAREFKRVHALHWSHGDSHLGNILYDGERARLIDFETRHEPSVSSLECQADDLLVCLLDLIGRDPNEGWREWSQDFLRAYDAPDVLQVFMQQLHMPLGWKAILWKSRTNYLPNIVLAERLAGLKRIAGDLLCDT